MGVKQKQCIADGEASSENRRKAGMSDGDFMGPRFAK